MGRLIVVYQADPSGSYRWLPAPRPDDVIVALDVLACADLAAREPLVFDRLESWTERSADEHRVAQLLAAIGAHPAVQAVTRRGVRVFDFAEYRLLFELTSFLRGRTLARAAADEGAPAGAGVSEVVFDPALPGAMAIGVCAALGLNPRSCAYALPPALPGSRGRRAIARQLMRATAAASRAEEVRVAAVAAGKLSLALGALPDADLRAAGVGLMPFPGLDHGNGLLLALRRRLPLLGTHGPARPARPGAGSPGQLPPRLDVEQDADLDRALALLVSRVLTAAAPELDQGLLALRGLDGARSLRAVLLPSGAYGASRLLIGWARERGLQVGAMQHGIYGLREHDGGDRRVDVVFGWGEATAEQTAYWPAPRPAVCPIGVPGLRSTPGLRALQARACTEAPGACTAPERVLIATTGPTFIPLAPASICEMFIETLVPSLRALARAGVALQLRPSPSQDPERQRRLLGMHGLEVQVTPDGPFAEAVAGADLLLAQGSSVAFEAAALGKPVLMWVGPAPRWVREEHLLPPWTDVVPGLFETAPELLARVQELIERPAEGFRVAHELSRRLARYAQPFAPASFAAGLRELAS